MTRILYILTLLIGMTFQSFAQSVRGPMSSTAIGHMAVTLLSPAAISAVQGLRFSNVSLRSTTSPVEESASLTVADEAMQMATIRIQGNKSSYSVTVTNHGIGFNKNGTTISVDNFSMTSETDGSGAGTIHIGGTMRLKKEVLDSNEKMLPLAVTVNYN